MGSNNSKRTSHLSRDEKRWLESQNPDQIAALITAARKSQSLNALASTDLITSASISKHNKDRINYNPHLQQHLHHQSQHRLTSRPNHYVSAASMAAAAANGIGQPPPFRGWNDTPPGRDAISSSSRYHQQQLSHQHPANWQLQSLNYHPSLQPSAIGGGGVRASNNKYRLYGKQQYLHQQAAHVRRYQQRSSRPATALSPQPSLEGDSLLNGAGGGVYSYANSIDHLNRPAEQDFELYYGDMNVCNGGPNSNQMNLHSNHYNSQQHPINNINNTIMSCNNNTSSSAVSKNVAAGCNECQQRGLNFTRQQRVQLGLVGLLPPAHQSKDTQISWVLNYLQNCCGQDPLVKYVFLRNLKDLNEPLFYATLMSNVETLMPIVYTPIVGLACQKYSHIFMQPRGLFISLHDAGMIPEILSNWKQKDVRVIVVTDGERILGLGDLGANGMGISVGKLSLYTALAGVHPKDVLPVTLDVGTNNETNLADPFYIGLRQKRARGQEYNALVDEFMRSVVERWGRSCLIQFEDFGNQNAFTLLQRYRASYCTFNDDIQGTASVCLSGLLSASKMIDKRLKDTRFLFYGSGEANLGTAKLLEMAMIDQGIEPQHARSNIWLVDSKGLVVTSRTDLTEHKMSYAQHGPTLVKLLDIIQHVKPCAIIGASAQGGAFDESVCRLMATQNERPIIFALSNPTSKAECTAQQAYEWTDGKCVFASGSPFEPVEFGGRRYVTGQGNNAYIFPAVGLAAIAAHIHTIPEECFLVAAKALSDLLTLSEISVGLVYPSLARIRECTLKIAACLLEYLYSERLATYRPEPTDKVNFLKSMQYDPSYPSIPGLSNSSDTTSGGGSSLTTTGSSALDEAITTKLTIS